MPLDFRGSNLSGEPPAQFGFPPLCTLHLGNPHPLRRTINRVRTVQLGHCPRLFEQSLPVFPGSWPDYALGNVFPLGVYVRNLGVRVGHFASLKPKTSLTVHALGCLEEGKPFYTSPFGLVPVTPPPISPTIRVPRPPTCMVGFASLLSLMWRFPFVDTDPLMDSPTFVTWVPFSSGWRGTDRTPRSRPPYDVRHGVK